MLQTSRRIASLDPDDYMEVHVIGSRGSGKSTYAWQVCAETIRLLHPEWKKGSDWYLKYAFENSLVHGLSELIDIIHKYSSVIEPEDRLDVLWWDDASVHGSKYLYYYDLENYMLLQGMWDTIRSGIRCLILTTPEPEELAPFIRGSKATLVRVTKRSNNAWRHAKAYAKYRLPISRQLRGVPIYVDEFKVPDGTEVSSIPTSLYKQFRQRRAKYLHDITSKIKARKDITEQRASLAMAKTTVAIEKYKKEIAALKGAGEEMVQQ